MIISQDFWKAMSRYSYPISTLVTAHQVHELPFLDLHVELHDMERFKSSIKICSKIAIPVCLCMESQHSEHTQANQDDQVHEYRETKEQPKWTLWKTGMAHNSEKTDQEYIWETPYMQLSFLMKSRYVVIASWGTCMCISVVIAPNFNLCRLHIQLTPQAILH